jgi:hypothetical protein
MERASSRKLRFRRPDDPANRNAMRIYCFDQENERLGCSDLAAYATQALQLSHASLLKVLDVHVSDTGRWRLITAGLPDRIALIADIAKDAVALDTACSFALTLAEAYAYLYRLNFRGGKTFSWEIECIAASRGEDGQWRLALVPPSPADIGALQRNGFYGNPRFAARELLLADDAKPNEATDSFTLGAILYHLVTGQPLIQASSPAEAMQLAYAADFPPVAGVNPALPGELAAFIGRAISREPGERPGLREWSFVMEKFGGRILQQPEESRLDRLPSAIEPAEGFRRVLGAATSGDTWRLGPGASSTYGGAVSGFAAALEEPPQPAEPPAPVIVDENVQFTVYRPKTVRPAQWYDLYAYAHLEDLPDDADPSEPQPKELVKRDAEKRLGAKVKDYKDTTEDSSQAVPREGELTFVPEMEGVEFNPPRLSFRWCERMHRAEFRLRASAALDGKQAVGQMSVFLGAILLADITLKIKVDSRHVSATEEPEAPERARPYRKIFASYSHRDLAIVEQFEHFAHAMGDRYLRDWKDLRAGETWDSRLLEMIEEADVFQLFWSRNSMRSEFVRKEWEHALSLAHKGQGFVRPTYWESPFPESPGEALPPPHLSRLHFTQLAPALAPGKNAPLKEPAGTKEEMPGAGNEPRDEASKTDGKLTPGSAWWVQEQVPDPKQSQHTEDSLATDEEFELTLNDSALGSAGTSDSGETDFELSLDDGGDASEFELDAEKDFDIPAMDIEDEELSVSLEDAGDSAPTSNVEDSSDFELADSYAPEEDSNDDESGSQVVALDDMEMPTGGRNWEDSELAADEELEAGEVLETPRARRVEVDAEEDFPPAREVVAARGGASWLASTCLSLIVTLGAIIAAHLLGLF